MANGVRYKQTKLIAALGIGNPSLQRLLVLPGCPKADSDGTYSLVEMQVFAEANMTTNHGTGTSAVSTRFKLASTIKREKEAERESLRVDELKKLLVRRQDLEDALSEVASRQRQTLTRRLEIELPPRVYGKEIAEVRIIMADITREICQEMQNLMERWK